MAAGTKVTLVLVALLIVVLALYYGSISPKPAPAVVLNESAAQATDNQASPQQTEATRPSTPRRLTDPQPQNSPSPSNTSGRLLGESVEQALGSTSTTKAPSDSADTERVTIGDREPVTVHVATDSGGKDGPEPLPQPHSDDAEPEGESDAAGDPQDEPKPEPESTGESEPAPEPEPQPTPVPAPSPPAVPQPPPFTEYTVKTGDTMSSIARDWFGTESKWDLIAKANPLVDPNRLDVGQVLRLPPKDMQREEGATPPGPVGTTYVVRSGDNLSRIARQHYNDESKWRIIYDANRALLGDSPDNLRVGMRLTIPPAPQPAD